MIQTFLQMLAPAGVGELAMAALLAASFVASFITVAFGLGGGAVLLAIMASLVPPAALIPAHGVIQAGSNLGRAALTLKHVHWPAIPAFILGSIIGAASGGMLVIGLPPALVQTGVGLFIIWSVLGRPPRQLRDWPVMVGAFSSFLTMFFGATGMFVAVYTKALKLPRHGFVGTHATLMTVQHGIKTLTFGLLGFAFVEWLPFIAAMMVCGFVGTLAGRVILNRLDDIRFRRILDAILLLVAIRLVIAGLADLFRLS